jgi:hypothetical protein
MNSMMEFLFSLAPRLFEVVAGEETPAALFSSRMHRMNMFKLIAMCIDARMSRSRLLALAPDASRTLINHIATLKDKVPHTNCIQTVTCSYKHRISSTETAGFG